MIHVTSIVIKSWCREGVIAIALKDDPHMLAREGPRRNLRRHLKTEPIHVRGPLCELQRAQLSLCLALDWPPERRPAAAFVKRIRRNEKHLPEFLRVLASVSQRINR